MPQTATTNRRLLLASRPTGRPDGHTFRRDEAPVPSPGAGEVLLRTLYLSLDPYMREAMNEQAPLYAESVPLDTPMIGATVNQVVESKHPDFREGDIVLGEAGWQDYALSDGTALTPLGTMEHPSHALGTLGMTGFTAYVGVVDIGKPQAGETLVVAAATGAVGSVVGQIAKLKGARAVGIAGGPQKCRHAVEELGFDACIDHREPDLAARLAAACPDGIDVYFENVGGQVFDAVLPLLNLQARIPLCGFISHYNDDTPPAGPDRLPHAMATLHQKRVTLQGLIILDHYGERYEDFQRDMGAWVRAGKVTTNEDVTDGLENAPAAFAGLLEGRNLGKVIVRVAS